MKVLVYCWGSLCEPGLINSIRRAGDECVVFSRQMKDYHADGEFAQEFLKVLHGREGKDIKAVISYDYFPLLSMLCQVNGLPYAAWIYDCPQYTLYSASIRNNCNYFFCFDRVQALDLQSRGALNVYSLPLGADVGLAQTAANCGIEDRRAMKHEVNEPEKREPKTAVAMADISFLGSLYEQYADKSLVSGISEHTRGFLQGVMNAQSKVYGYNFIKETLSPEMTEELAKAWNLQLGEYYEQDSIQMVADMINRELSAVERVHFLEVLSEVFAVTLYSGSKLPEKLQDKRIQLKGFADYATEMPRIFRNSRINLNHTVRTITSGMPQRVLDICVCGGFCLTNYQEEIAEYFNDGQELAMYASMEELRDKAAFYLANEEERSRIARAGQEKVLREFTIEAQWGKMKACLGT